MTVFSRNSVHCLSYIVLVNERELTEKYFEISWLVGQCSLQIISNLNRWWHFRNEWILSGLDIVLVDLFHLLLGSVPLEWDKKFFYHRSQELLFILMLISRVQIIVQYSFPDNFPGASRVSTLQAKMLQCCNIYHNLNKFHFETFSTESQNCFAVLDSFC